MFPLAPTKLGSVTLRLRQMEPVPQTLPIRGPHMLECLLQSALSPFLVPGTGQGQKFNFVRCRMPGPGPVLGPGHRKHLPSTFRKCSPGGGKPTMAEPYGQGTPSPARPAWALIPTSPLQGQQDALRSSRIHVYGIVPGPVARL